MSKIPSKSTRYYLDQYAMAGHLTAVDMDVSQELAPATCISDTGPRVVAGNYGHKHALRGLFDGDSSMIDAVSQALIGSSSEHYLAELFAGTAEGAPVYESIVQASGKPVKVASGAAVVLEIPAEGAGGLSRGMILRNATLGGTDTGTSIDQGAGGSTTGGRTYQTTFRFLPGTYTNAVLQLQHSSDNAIWASSTDLTASSTGNAKAVRTTTTAALNRYLRVIASTIAGGTDVPVLVTGGAVAGSAPPVTT